MTDVEKSTIEIILKSDNAIYISGTMVRSRPDIIMYFKNKFYLDDCGFFANIYKKQLVPGKYEIGVRVYQKGEKMLLSSAVSL